VFFVKSYSFATGFETLVVAILLLRRTNAEKRIDLRLVPFVLFPFLRFPGRDDLLNLFWPVDLSATFVAVFCQEKNLTLTVRAEESLLCHQLLGHGNDRNPRRMLLLAYDGICCFTSPWNQNQLGG